VRGDEGLCRRLLEPFREDREEEEEEDGTFRGTVEGWAEGGKVKKLPSFFSLINYFEREY